MEPRQCSAVGAVLYLQVGLTEIKNWVFQKKKRRVPWCVLRVLRSTERSTGKPHRQLPFAVVYMHSPGGPCGI
jgi:hypothetical protein